MFVDIQIRINYFCNNNTGHHIENLLIFVHSRCINIFPIEGIMPQ